jgi:hypothetical protein
MPPQQVSNQYQPYKPGSKSNIKFFVIIGVLILLLVGLIIFAMVTFGQMQDYKNNSDQKSAKAVKEAKAEQEKILKAAFAEAEKEPLKSYTSPSAFGSVKILYPKTWSAYILENSSDGTPVDGYFYPDFVPNTSSDKKNNFALRIVINNNRYQAELQKHQSNLKLGKTTSTTFKPQNVADAPIGVRLDGIINSGKKGSMVILPLRDKVLKVWTENQANQNDFNNFVLKNLTYSP